MKGKMSFVQKLKAMGALSVVFLLVLATNMMDNNHFKVVQKSLTTVYADRLVAKDHIYKISRQLETKELALFSSSITKIVDVNSHANDSIEKTLAQYKSTKLTNKESLHFNSLQKKLDKLYEIETRLTTDTSTVIRDHEDFNKLLNQHAAITRELDILAEIQMSEGRRQVKFSNDAIAKSKFISQLEIGALIIIGVIIQLLIFFKPSKKY